jgi:hypothetical protein
METLRCKDCAAVQGEAIGNAIIIDARGERIEIVNAASVTRVCRRCGSKNELMRAAILTH